jgi:hypothetical protein
MPLGYGAHGDSWNHTKFKAKESAMKRTLGMLLAVGAIIVFWGSVLAPVSVQSDPKPAPNLTGTMELDFNSGWGGSPDIPIWWGTITFEDGSEYDMNFYHLSPFKDHSQASPFEERWEIIGIEGSMAGTDEGVTVLANKPPEPCTYRMNGTITEASGVFAGWVGRHVHMSGIITWDPATGAPVTAPGTFRAN